MSSGLNQHVESVRAAASAAGDVSGNCDEALYMVGRGDMPGATERLVWAEENARSALFKITQARAALAKAKGGA
jgi:hypothetical protein